MCTLSAAAQSHQADNHKPAMPAEAVDEGEAECWKLRPSQYQVVILANYADHLRHAQTLHNFKRLVPGPIMVVHDYQPS